MALRPVAKGLRVVGLSALTGSLVRVETVEVTARTTPIIEELTLEQCLRLLSSVPVGRVGVTIDALPAVLPVNFVVHDDAVIFRTVPGTKLDAATAGAVVAFEADGYGSNAFPNGWSVLVRGIAREITDAEDIAAARRLPLESWAWDGGADRFVRIELTVVSGRRVRDVPTAG